MKSKDKNELQSRREFFKGAAKVALPFLIGSVFVSSPLLAQTSSTTVCKAGCKESCKSMCKELCSYACSGTCKTTCGKDPCGNQCRGVCVGSCKNKARK